MDGDPASMLPARTGNGKPNLWKVCAVPYGTVVSSHSVTQSVTHACMRVATTAYVHLLRQDDCIRGWMAEWLWGRQPVHWRSSCARLQGA